MLPSGSLIPIHDENPTRSFSYLTAALIVVNVLLTLSEPSLGQGSSSEVATFFYRWGMVPWEITHGRPVTQEVLRAAGMPITGCPPTACFPEKNVYLALLTSMFLHGGILHLGGNMLFMWVFGNNIEDTLGKVRFVLFYLAVGVAASLAHVLVGPNSVLPTVGASGAIAGLLGAYIVLFPRARITTLVPIFFLQIVQLPATVVLGIWFVSQFFIGVGQQFGGGGVAWMAHVGGFAAGALLILLLGGRGLIRPAGPTYREPGPLEPW